MHTSYKPHRRRISLFARAQVSSFDDQQLCINNVVYGQRDDSWNGAKFWRVLIINFFLRLLPLKVDELVVSEMRVREIGIPLYELSYIHLEYWNNSPQVIKKKKH